jgi:hypothetical protein
MKLVSWRWLLPIVQLVVALACHVYEPHEYRVAYRAAHANPVDYSIENSPAPVGRASLGLNFPALVIAFPFRNQDGSIFKWNSDFTLVWISPKDIAYFLGILLFWQWVGTCLGQAFDPTELRSRALIPPIAWLAGGLVFGLLTLLYAGSMIYSGRRAACQIGAAGVVWGCGLAAFFARRLVIAFGVARSSLDAG